MKRACSTRTASSIRSRGIIQVILNDDVAVPRGSMPAARNASSPARTFRYVALMPVPTTLTAASPSISEARLPNRCAIAARSCSSSCRFSREITTVVRFLKTCSCLPGTPRSSRSVSRSVAGASLSRRMTSRSLATPTTVPGLRGGLRRSTGRGQEADPESRARRWQCRDPSRTRRPGR